jgi:hypothetical protein
MIELEIVQPDVDDGSIDTTTGSPELDVATGP